MNLFYKESKSEKNINFLNKNKNIFVVVVFFGGGGGGGLGGRGAIE